MITEDYVSFEIAKLLKKKGFEGYSIISTYDENAADAYIKELREKHLPYSSDDPKLKEFRYTVPTLQMAMKWLREEYDLIIYVKLVNDGDPYHDAWGFSIYNKFTTNEYIKSDKLWFKYEEACEAAIKYSLENLV